MAPEPTAVLHLVQGILPASHPRPCWQAAPVEPSHPPHSLAPKRETTELQAVWWLPPFPSRDDGAQKWMLDSDVFFPRQKAVHTVSLWSGLPFTIISGTIFQFPSPTFWCNLFSPHLAVRSALPDYLDELDFCPSCVTCCVMVGKSFNLLETLFPFLR